MTESMVSKVCTCSCRDVDYLLVKLSLLTLVYSGLDSFQEDSQTGPSQHQGAHAYSPPSASSVRGEIFSDTLLSHHTVSLKHIADLRWTAFRVAQGRP